jgi:hypothetical protein
MNTEDLNKIYMDILSIKIDSKDSFESMINKFYEVMRKHGIKHGTKTESGSICVVNAAWNMCWAVYISHKMTALDIWMLLSDVPNDLKY